MARFATEFVDREGRRQREVLVASARDEALTILRSRADIILTLRPTTILDDLLEAFSARFGGRRINDARLQSFAHILGAYLKAGISIQEALRLTAAANPDVAGIAHAVRGQLGVGLAMDDAMRASGFQFPQSFVALVKAGAEAGNVHDVLSNEARRIRAFQEIRRDLATSLIYPAALIIMCVLVVGFMLAFIVPQIRASISEEAYRTIPAFSAAIFAASDGINALTPGIAAIGTVTVVGILILIAKATTEWRQRKIVQLPVVGRIITSLAASSFCYSLGTMLAASVRTELAWGLAARGVSQPFIRARLEAAGTRIVQGAQISTAAIWTGVLPEDVNSVFALGERTGTLPKLLLEVAEFHAGEALSRLRKLSSIAAPVVIMIAGIIVGAFAVAMMSTILSVNQVYAG
jgi:general secretion pathway protein F